MSNNRHLINDSDIVRPMQLLDKGLPLPFLTGRYVVDEGWVAVITEGGVYKETLLPGTHFLNRYSMWRDVKAIAVDTRIGKLDVSTQREFAIAHPVSVEINLDLGVEYRVSDARRVALEVRTPLTNLFDRVIQAVRGAVVNATYDEIRTQGEGIARIALQRLQAMRLPETVGLEVLNVLVTTIQALDAGASALANQQMSEFTKARDWQLDNLMISQSRVTPEWLMVHRPEIYQQLMAGNQALLKEMIDKGLLDPAGFLNQPSGADPMDPLKLMGNFGFPGLGMGPGQSPGTPPPQLAASSNPAPAAGRDIHARMREEIGYLEKLPGAKVAAKPGADASGVPDGSYNLLITLGRNSGGKIALYVACLPGYPQVPPTVDVEVDDQATAFQSAVLRRWTGQYLVEIAREVKQYFG